MKFLDLDTMFSFRFNLGWMVLIILEVCRWVPSDCSYVLDDLYERMNTSHTISLTERFITFNLYWMWRSKLD